MKIPHWLSRVGKGQWVHIAFRLVLMVLGIAVIGLYAQDLNRAHQQGKYSDGKWVS